MNREIYPGGIYPLTGDVLSQAGNHGVLVTGLQSVPVAAAAVADGEVLTYSASNGNWAGQPLPVATSTSLGVVEPDNSTITVNAAGVLSVLASAIGGTGSLLQNGYITFGNGLIVQWCLGNYAASGTSRGNYVATYPIPFPNSVFHVQTTVIFPSAITTTNWQGAAFYVNGPLNLAPNTLSQVQLYADERSDSATDSAYQPFVLAIGY